MIGLGSNRLTVCRRGGMSVTQAGRGGMEWLAGNGLRERTPYSAQATAALKAQFPTQWPTIRDYGFAHPEIVGYMNAYAPEDAKIAYSLVPTLGVRWIANGGSGACINSGFVANDYSHSYEIRATWEMENLVNNTCLLGAVSNGSAFGNVYISGIECQVWGAYNWVNTGLTFNVAANTEYDDSIKFDFDSNKGYRTLNGSSIEKNVDMRTRVTIPAFIFAYNNGGTPGQQTNCKFRNVQFLGDDNIAKDFVPFVCKARTSDQCYPNVAQAEGTKGLLDMKTGLFHYNIGSGSFTISESPSSQTT